MIVLFCVCVCVFCAFQPLIFLPQEIKVIVLALISNFICFHTGLFWVEMWVLTEMINGYYRIQMPSFSQSAITRFIITLNNNEWIHDACVSVVGKVKNKKKLAGTLIRAHKKWMRLSATDGLIDQRGHLVIESILINSTYPMMVVSWGNFFSRWCMHFRSQCGRPIKHVMYVMMVTLPYCLKIGERERDQHVKTVKQLFGVDIKHSQLED